MNENENVEAQELRDNQLDGVSDGYLCMNDKSEWEVIDSRGEVVGGSAGYIGEDKRRRDI